MTLIGTFRAPHGAVIIADSQETIGQWKCSVLKIKPEVINGVHFLAAGSCEDAIEMEIVVEEIRRRLQKSPCQSLHGFRKICERELSRLSTKKQKGMELTIVAVVRKRFEIWRSQRNRLLVVPHDRPTLSGYGNDLYQHIAQKMYAQFTSGVQLILIGLRILELARRSSSYVDSPYSGAIVSAGGIAELDRKLLDEFTKSIAVIGEYTEKLFISACDTNYGAEAFGVLLKDVSDSLKHLRGESLQTIAALEYEHEQKYGYRLPMKLTPDRTMRTVRHNPSTGEAEVEIEEFTPSISEKSEREP